MAQPIGAYKGLTVTELEYLILWEIGQVTATTPSYSRFPKWLIRQKLTQKQNEFCFISQCIKKGALIAVKTGYEIYNLPSNAMEGGLVSAKYYTSTTDYTDLDIVDREYLDDHHEGWKVADDGDPQYIFPGLTYGNTPTIGIYPKPDEDATKYTGSGDTGVFIGDSCPGATANFKSTCTSTGSGTTLNDTATDFRTLGLVAGMYVLNITDGSYARVSSTADHALTTTALTGGTLNVWTSADEYLILAGEYMPLVFLDDHEKYAFGYRMGRLSDITIPAGNIYIEYVPYPLAFAYDYSAADASQGNDDQYPEIPRLYHTALADGVIGDLLKTFHEKSKEFARADYYLKSFANAATSARSSKESRPFKKKPSLLYPRMKR